MRPRRPVVVGAALLVASFSGLGTAAVYAQQHRTDGEPSRPASASTGFADIALNRTPDEKARDIANAPPQMRAGLEAQMRQIEQNRVPVAGPRGFAGYVTASALNKPEPQVESDLPPVVDDSGKVVAYWATGIGVIDKEVVDAPGETDFAAERQKKGIHPVP